METRQEYACLIHKVGLNSYVLVEDTNKYSMCQHTRTQMITQTRHTDVSVHPAVSSLKKILSLNSSVLFLDGWKEAWSGWPKYANTTVALCLLTQQPGPICSVAVIFRVKKPIDLLLFTGMFITGQVWLQFACVQYIYVYVWVNTF